MEIKRNKVVIIAEGGVNHNGDIELAKELVRSAAKVGADIIKFQFFNPDSLVNRFLKPAPYQKANDIKSQYQMLKRYEFTEKEFLILKNYANENGIEFLVSVFGIDELNIAVKKLGMKLIKIPSGELTNLRLLREAVKLNTQVLLSTGMATIDEIRAAVNILKSGKKNFYLLHCCSLYPAPYNLVNLRTITLYQKLFKVPVGYSDHTEGDLCSLIATALGAQVIEKHFTLDKTMQGPDHKASLEPAEFKNMVDKIRKVEEILGSEKRCISAEEKKMRFFARKGIYAKKDIKKGEKFGLDNLETLRPEKYLSLIYLDKIIGKRAKCNLAKGTAINKNHF